MQCIDLTLNHLAFGDKHRSLVIGTAADRKVSVSDSGAVDDRDRWSESLSWVWLVECLFDGLQRAVLTLSDHTPKVVHSLELVTSQYSPLQGVNVRPQGLHDIVMPD